MSLRVERGTHPCHGPKPQTWTIAPDTCEGLKGMYGEMAVVIIFIITSKHLLSSNYTHRHHATCSTYTTSLHLTALRVTFGSLRYHVCFYNTRWLKHVVGGKPGHCNAEVASVELQFSPAYHGLALCNNR